MSSAILLRLLCCGLKVIHTSASELGIIPQAGEIEKSIIELIAGLGGNLMASEIDKHLPSLSTGQLDASNSHLIHFTGEVLRAQVETALADEAFAKLAPRIKPAALKKLPAQWAVFVENGHPDAQPLAHQDFVVMLGQILRDRETTAIIPPGYLSAFFAQWFQHCLSDVIIKEDWHLRLAAHLADHIGTALASGLPAQHPAAVAAFKSSLLRFHAEAQSYLQRIDTGVWTLQEQVKKVEGRQKRQGTKTTKQYKDLKKDIGTLKTITTARLRAHLLEASQTALAKDLAEAEAEALQGDWQRRETLRQAAQSAHQQRIEGIEPLIIEFARIEGNSNATEVAKELIRIAQEQGVPEALLYLESQQEGILNSVARLKSDIREKLRPFLSGAQLARASGDNARAATLLLKILQADPTWADVRYKYCKFLVDNVGPRTQTHDSLTSAQKIFEEALNQARRLIQDEPDNQEYVCALSLSYERLGDITMGMHKLGEADVLYTKALKLRAKLHLSDPLDYHLRQGLCISYSKLGDVAEAQGNYKEAQRLFTYSLRLSEDLVNRSPDNPQSLISISICYERLGVVAVAQREFNEAFRLYDQALKMRNHLIMNSPENFNWQRGLSISYYKLSEVTVAQGKLSEASCLLARAFEISERLALNDPTNFHLQRDLSIIYSLLGKVSLAQGNISEALSLLANARKLLEKLVASDPLNAEWLYGLSYNYNTLGEANTIQENYSEALNLFLKGFKLFEKQTLDDPANTLRQRDLATCLYRLGDLHQRQEQWAKALPYFERCQSISEQLSAQDSCGSGWQKNVQVIRKVVQQVREKLGLEK